MAWWGMDPGMDWIGLRSAPAAMPFPWGSTPVYAPAEQRAVNKAARAVGMRAPWRGGGLPGVAPHAPPVPPPLAPRPRQSPPPLGRGGSSVPAQPQRAPLRPPDQTEISRKRKPASEVTLPSTSPTPISGPSEATAPVPGGEDRRPSPPSSPLRPPPLKPPAPQADPALTRLPLARQRTPEGNPLRSPTAQALFSAARVVAPPLAAPPVSAPAQTTQAAGLRAPKPLDAPSTSERGSSAGPRFAPRQPAQRQRPVLAYHGMGASTFIRRVRREAPAPEVPQATRPQLDEQPPAAQPQARPRPQSPSESQPPRTERRAPAAPTTPAEQAPPRSGVASSTAQTQATRDQPSKATPPSQTRTAPQAPEQSTPSRTAVGQAPEAPRSGTASSSSPAPGGVRREAGPPTGEVGTPVAAPQRPARLPLQSAPEALPTLKELLKTLPAGARVVRQEGDLVEIALPQESMRDLGGPVDWSAGVLRGAPLRPQTDLGGGGSVGLPARPPLYSPSAEFVAPRKRSTQTTPAPTPRGESPEQATSPASPAPARRRPTAPPLVQESPRAPHRQRQESPAAPRVDWRTPPVRPAPPPAVARKTGSAPVSAPAVLQRARGEQASPVPQAPQAPASLRPGLLTRRVQLRGLSSAFDEGIDWTRAGLGRAPIHSPDAQTIGRRRPQVTPPAEETPLPRGLPADAPPPPIPSGLEAPRSPGSSPGPQLGRAPDLRGTASPTALPERRLRAPVGSGSPETPILARRAAWEGSVEVPLRRTRPKDQPQTPWESPSTGPAPQLSPPPTRRTPSRQPARPETSPPQRPQRPGSIPTEAAQAGPRAMLRPPTLGSQRGPGLSGTYSQSIDWSRAGAPQTPLLSRYADTSATIKRSRRALPETSSAATVEPAAAREADQAPQAGVRTTRPPTTPGTGPTPTSLRQSATAAVDWRRPGARGPSLSPSAVEQLRPSSTSAGRHAGAPSTLPSRGLQAQAEQTSIRRAKPSVPRDLRDAFTEGQDWRSPELMSGPAGVAGQDASPRFAPSGSGQAQTPALARQQAWEGQPTVAPRRTSLADGSPEIGVSRAVRRGGTRSLAARGRGLDFRTPPSSQPQRKAQAQREPRGTTGPGRAPIQSPDAQHIARRAAEEQPRGLSGLAPRTRDPQSAAAKSPSPAPLAQMQAFQGSPTFIAPRKPPEPEPQREADSSSSALQSPSATPASGAPRPSGQKSGGKRLHGGRDGGYHPSPFEADEEAWSSGDFPDIEWQAEPAKRRRVSAPKPEPSPPPDVLQEMAREQMVEVLKTLTTQSPEARELLEEIMEAVQRIRDLDHLRKF